MSRTCRAMCALVMGAGLGACADREPLGAPPPDGSVAVPPRDASLFQTDSLVYTLVRNGGAFEAQVVVTMRNEADTPVYIEQCGPEPHVVPGIRRADGDTTWVDLGGSCARIGGVPHLEVRARGTFVDTVQLAGIVQCCMNPPDHPSHRIGLFRLTYRMHQEPGMNDESPEGELVRSNAFRTVYSPGPTTAGELCNGVFCPR